MSDFVTQGFTVVASCYAKQECDRLLTQIAPIAKVGTRRMLDHSWCRHLARDLQARLETNIPQLKSLVAVQCTYFNKSIDGNWFVAVHQDRSIPIRTTAELRHLSGWACKVGVAYIHGPDELLERMIAIRLHMDDSTPNNGPLRVLAGSHRCGTLSPDEIEVLCQKYSETTLLVDQGGIIAMQPLLLHGSSKSQTAESRRVRQFLYGPTDISAPFQWHRAVI